MTEKATKEQSGVTKVDFAGLLDHSAKVLEPTEASSGRQSFKLPEPAKDTASSKGKRKAKDTAEDVVTNVEDKRRKFVTAEKPTAKKAEEETKGKNKGKTIEEVTEMEELVKDVEQDAMLVDAADESNLQAGLAASITDLITAGSGSSSSSASISVATTSMSAGSVSPAHGHVREGWVYDAKHGRYFPPPGDVNGGELWKCSKCGRNREQTQDKFFTDPSTRARMDFSINQCILCLKRYIGQPGGWKPPKAPWQ